MLFRENPTGIIKVGFRSKGHNDVAQIASSLGGGGQSPGRRGHHGRQFGTIQERVIAAVREVIK
jgi:nanoRNase/pAp phosphatase (c-di-AMP/oligoRNAs hydrolase)